MNCGKVCHAEDRASVYGEHTSRLSGLFAFSDAHPHIFSHLSKVRLTHTAFLGDSYCGRFFLQTTGTLQRNVTQAMNPFSPITDSTSPGRPMTITVVTPVQFLANWEKKAK